MENLKKSTGMTGQELQIEVLSEYMPEMIAMAFAENFECLEGYSCVKGDIRIVILSVFPDNIYETFWVHGWFGNEPTLAQPAIYKENHPVPEPGDWAVCANYQMEKRNEQGEWEAYYDDDGYWHGDLLGNIIKEYSIEI